MCASGTKEHLAKGERELSTWQGKKKHQKQNPQNSSSLKKGAPQNLFLHLFHGPGGSPLLRVLRDAPRATGDAWGGQRQGKVGSVISGVRSKGGAGSEHRAGDPAPPPLPREGSTAPAPLRGRNLHPAANFEGCGGGGV